MKRSLRKGTAILLTLCMTLALIPQASYVYAGGSIEVRDLPLDLTADEVDYQILADSKVETRKVDLNSENITDSIEGWKWYPQGDQVRGYASNTLELSGIKMHSYFLDGIILPADSTIVLLDKTTNLVDSICEFGGATDTGTGIKCKGTLTIEGTGALEVYGGTDAEGALDISRAIEAEGDLIIKSGTIRAYGVSANSESTAFCAAGVVTIEGGTLTAEGGASDTRSVGIKGRSITFEGGTIIAKASGSGERYSALITSSSGSFVATGMSILVNYYNSYIPVSGWETKGNLKYYIDEDWRAADDLLIEKLSATISNETISGVIGTKLSNTPNMTISLEGTTFINLTANADVSNWFKNMPDGLIATLLSISGDGSSASIGFNGTPAEASNSVMVIKIPNTKLKCYEEITVDSNNNAKYAITGGETSEILNRQTSLDLTVTELSYRASGTEDPKTANPITSDITDSAEGWKWYLHGDTTKGYGDKTLELDGINLEANAMAGIKLPTGSTIVLMNNSTNYVQSTWSTMGNTCGIQSLGSLTIKGESGVLESIGGTPFQNGESTGIKAASSIAIGGGQITAIGRAVTNPMPGATSLGIFAFNSITITGGTIYAKADNGTSIYDAIRSTYITDADMVAFQHAEDNYSIPVHVSDGRYVYGTLPDRADDIKITKAPTLPPASFGGNGTEADPYLITTKAELKEMAQVVNEQNAKYGDKHYRVMAHIILNDDGNGAPEQWTPIGKNDDSPFSGVFDGGSHTIKGINVNAYIDYAGLFGYIKSGTVRNVGLKGGQIMAPGSNSNAGGIAGYNNGGRIEDCFNTASIVATQSGGIVGSNVMGHIQDSYNTGNVSGFAAGGIAGINQDAELTIVNCYNTGSVNAIKNNNPAYAGGITGKNYSATIKNSYNAGTIFASGIVNGQAYLGGVYGTSLGSTLENVYWINSALLIDSSYGNSNIGTPEVKTAEELKSLAKTLNDHVTEMSHSYSSLSPWKTDIKDQNSGYPIFGTATNYSLTVSGGGIGSTASGSIEEGTVVSINAGAKVGYQFNGWASSGGGSFGSSSLAQTTFIMPEFDVTITANWTENGSESLERTNALDLTVKELWYKSQTEITSSDPTSENIIDSAEGWKWYLYGDEEKGYSPKTLELSGINLDTNSDVAVKLPAAASIVLVDGTINRVKSTYHDRFNTYGIEGNGALTIKGSTGELHATGGTTTENNSVGILADKTILIEGGNIYATGGVSTSSYPVVMSVGIVSNQNIIFSGGTIYANASAAPLSRAVYTLGIITDTGMQAFQKKDGSYSQEAQVQGGSYVYGTNQTPATDIKITAVPSVPDPSFGGEGTEADPYLIANKEELKEMAQLVNEQNTKYGDKHYRVTANITLNDDINNDPEVWTPIGKNNILAFTGSFDGNGHAITGIYVNGASYAGLFGYLDSGSTVRNIGMKGGQIYASGGNSYAGGIAAYNRGGRIEDCFNTASIGGTQSGGITGYNEMGHIQDSYNTGQVVGIIAGGIAGVNQDAEMTIVNCYNTGSVNAVRNSNSAYAGGITGKNYSGTVKNSYNAGSVSTVSAGAGSVYLGGASAVNNSSTLVDVYWLNSALDIDNSYGDGNTGSAEAKTSEELKSMAQTLNQNAAGLSSEYDDLASWIDDAKNENGGYPLFGTVTNYTLTISGGGTGATADGSYAAGTIVSIHAGTKEGYTFNGWTTAGGGTFENASNAETIFTMPEENTTITANWKSNDEPGPGPGPNNPSRPTPSAKPEDTNVLINGKSQSAGKAETTTGSDGKTLTTVTVDSDKLKSLLSAEKEGAKVTIPIKDGVNAGEGKLTGEMVKSMESKGATLVIQKGASSYTLPAAEINITEVSKKLGTNVSLEDITVSVRISEPTNTMAKVVESAEKGKGFTIVAPAVDFTITCTYGGKSVNTASFNSYVERTIAIPEGVDPSKITTGIVVEPSGTIYHVPTRVTVINGTCYAVINSLTNSTYSVVWNPIEFSDMTKHWAKESVNNMGSRMVVTGVGNNSYDPGRNMTRAEFAAIMVRALGLAPDSAASTFSDIKATSWYSGYIKTAVSYGIIKGYDNGSFGPNDTITREQAMTMLSRAMKVTGLKVDLADQSITKLIGSYTDSTAISAYAKESVAACIETGITAGRGNNTIAPKSFITRAEVAVMAERLLKKSDLI